MRSFAFAALLAAFLALPATISATPVPTWDRIVAGPKRFKVLSQFNDEAVLDKETGVVWERSPSTTNLVWIAAAESCVIKEVGGRRGWRLPTIEELNSLIDDSQSPALPVGHPFSVETDVYWSVSTSFGGGPTTAYAVTLATGVTFTGRPKSNATGVWCVRGQQGFDAP